MPSLSAILDEKHGFEPYFPEQRLPPSELLVSELEEEIGVSLPADYRSFLIRYGGTAPSLVKNCTPVVPVAGHKDLHPADYLLGFFRPEPKPHLQRFDLRYAYQDMKTLLGATFLPIMYGERPAMFCLKLTGERRGSIWAWLRDPVDIETKWEDIRELWGLYFVAPDLASFVCSFQN